MDTPLHSTGLPPTSTSWEDILDYLDTRARELERYAARVGAGDSDVDDRVVQEMVQWTEPTQISPIPADLVGRATSVLQRQNILMVQLAEAADAVRAELESLTHHPRRPTRDVEAAPRFLDIAG